jgi:hypothetical protein
MEPTKTLNHNIANVAWGALFIWWGIAIMIDPITIGMSAIGSGVILLGANAYRLWKGIPTLVSTTIVGTIALTWGLLDQLRTILALSSGFSFAMLLVVVGVVVAGTTLVAHPADG